MKTQLKFFGIVTAFFAALLFTTCGGLENETVGTEAGMTGFMAGNIRVATAPLPIAEDIFLDDEVSLVSEDAAPAPLNKNTDTVNVRFRPMVSKGAKAWWGLGSADMRPFKFYDTRVNANFDNGDLVYFKVTSEDGLITNYYRYEMWVRSPVTDLGNLYVGRYETHTDTTDTGNEVTVVDVDERMLATFAKDNDGNNVSYPSLDSAVKGSGVGVLSIKTNQNKERIKVTPYDENAKIRFGLSGSYSGAPSMGTNNAFTLTDQSYLYIQVTAENEVDTAFYKFRVDVGRIASINTLSFVAGSLSNPALKRYGVASKGTQSLTWDGVGNGKYETADMPLDVGFSVEIELDDPASKASFEVISNKNAGNPNGTNTGNFANIKGSDAKVKFDGTNVLAIKIVSDNNQTRRYYKIEVTLLAANFAKQPKSDYYYYRDPSTTVGNPGSTINWYTYVGLATPATGGKFDSKGTGQVTALTVELDRPVTGTYQWYDCNSWYGGYGFDANGNISYLRADNGAEEAETAFTESTYHVKKLDEKKNVSLHNGGNQFYRLENPGRMLTAPNANGGSLSGSLANATTVPGPIPRINWRPFMGTSESHYYWVVVTDSNGNKAVSKRAVIISERDPGKDHYIVDMNEDLYSGTKGTANYEEGYAKNQKVFKIKRETYKIPVTFPDGFNIKDYSVATVQALFWLVDGTPWIQNWTQGDIGFEDADGMQVIYYNLTNNNGTLGLVGGGKEPASGTVDKKPKYLIVKPAGEKPVWDLPPLTAAGVPIPNNDAQGWFCGYIELVEVRFEGPAQ
jgi:hypothetical protein